MKRNVPTMFSIGIAICISLAIYLTLRYGKAEPAYKGQRLSQCVMSLRQFDGETGFHPPADSSIVIALRTIGRRSLPYLIKWISTPPPRSEGGAVTTEGHVNVEAEARRRLKKLGGNKNSSPSRSDAVLAYCVLGKEAKGAIPELATLAKNYVNEIHTNAAPHDIEAYMSLRYLIRALAGLGPDAVPVLLNVSTNLQGYQYQWKIIEQVGLMGSDGAAAIPAFTNWARDVSAESRWFACLALGRIGGDSSHVIPVLRTALNDPDRRVRGAAAMALDKYQEREQTTPSKNSP